MFDRQKLKEYRRQIKAFRRGVRRKVFGEGAERVKADKRVAPGAAHLMPTFSRSLSEAVADVAPTANGRYLTVGDQAFAREAKAALQAAGAREANIEWTSIAFEDLRLGAKALRDVDIGQIDGVIAGGKPVRAAYPQALRHIAQNCDADQFPTITWVGEGFEWCFGTIAFPSEAEDAEVFLFHPWDVFAGMKEFVLASFEVFDEKTTHRFNRIMAPNETFYFKLSDYLPKQSRVGASGLFVETFHPRLIGRRNHRWRVWADVLTKRSLTSLHGTHDDGAEIDVAEFIVDISKRHTDRLAITLPNYRHSLGQDTGPVRFKISDAEKGAAAAEQTHSRALGKQVEELTMDVAGADISDQNHFRITYPGYGGSYWYTFQKTDGATDNICSNHTCGSPYDGLPPARTDWDPQFLALAEHDYMIWPYPVPATGPEAEIDFGFNFLCSQPRFSHYKAMLMDEDGEHLDTLDINHDGHSHFMADTALAGLSNQLRGQTRQLLVLPNWRKENRHPRDVKVDGLLIAKHRRTGDYDATEFQDSWRNVGVGVSQYRHWLIDTMMLTGRTNIMGRFSPRSEMRHGVLLINSSGAPNYRTRVRATATVLTSDGRGMSAPFEVAPQGHALVWLEDLLPGVREWTRGQAATVLVRSADGDCNGHIVTIRGSEAVSLQHMWGY